MNQETQENNIQESSATPSLKAHIPLALFILYYFAFLPLVVSPLLNSIGFSSGTLGGVIISGLSFLLPAILYMLIVRQKPREVLPPKRLGMKNAAYIVLINIAAILVIVFLVYGHFNTIFTVFEHEPFELPPMSAMWIFLLANGLLTSTFEEIWCRGALYREYRRYGVSILKTAIITGVLFGVLHSGILQISYTAVMGVLWAFLFYFTRSIWAPILSHAVINIFFILLNPRYYVSDYTVFWDIAPTFTLVIGILAVVMIPIAIVCVIKLIKNNPVEKETKAKESVPFTAGYWALIATMIALAVIYQI